MNGPTTSNDANASPLHGGLLTRVPGLAIL